MQRFLLALLVMSLVSTALPTQAGWDDPAAGGTSDYAWIDTPQSGSEVNGVTYFNGTAGNNLTTAQSGSESNPLSEDPEGDQGPWLLSWCGVIPGCYIYSPRIPFSDVGNVWVTNDNGAEFYANMRLHEQPLESTPGYQSGTIYSAFFQHTRVGTTYWLESQLIAGMGWASRILVQTAPLAPGAVTSWCTVPVPMDVIYTPGPGVKGIISWRVDYSDLAASAPSSSCAGFSYGGNALVGDWLSCWEGETAHKGATPAGSISWAQFADVSNDPCLRDWQLGPAGASAGPWTADIYVNSVYHGSVTTTPTGQWTNYIIDFSAISSNLCLYRVKVVYGTAFDEKVYVDGNDGNGCTFGPPEVNEGTQVIKAPERPDPKKALAEASLSDPTGAYREWSRDGDLDGAPDMDDKCSFRHGGSGDHDGDGIGNNCDPDLDGDGIRNGVDNCAWHVNPDQLDTDRNGVGDACDADIDGDGWSDALDNCPQVSNSAQADLDRDGVGNLCDDDSDGDGVHDAVDVFPLDASEWGDLDKDGIGDNADPDADGDGFVNVVEVAASTDPMDRDSFPLELDGTHMQPSQTAGIGGLASIGIALGLVVVGALLLVALRRRDAQL